MQHLTKSVAETFNETDKKNISPEWLKDCVEKYYQRGKYQSLTEKNQSFFEIFEEFLEKHPLSNVRKDGYRVVFRTLKRYQAVNQAKNSDFTLELDTFTLDKLQDFCYFFRNEHEIYKQFPEIYGHRTPKPRGQNTLNSTLSKMRTLFLWSKKNKYTQNNPFENFSIEESVYGTPFYITIEERNKIYKTDFSAFPDLEKEKDIFVFQCVIGCRVADLYRFTKDNIIDGAIEYIARKTKDGRPVTVQVPLNSIAKEILAKYDNPQSNEILPFSKIYEYNKSIKEIFKIAEITRNVVVLDSVTREQVIRPINEVASSHIARRCFVGNLYKQVKDPNLVGALSGHREGSKAFVRYRTKCR